MTGQQDAYRALRASTLNQMDAARRLVNTYFNELVGEEQAGQATWKLARMVSLLADMLADLAVFVATTGEKDAPR